MATRIKPKRSETSSSVPTTSNLAVGEIAINSADQKIYTRDSNDNIVTLAQPGLLNVVEDTTPQLGGDLDVNGNSITGGTITLDGTVINLDASDNQIYLKDNGSEFGRFVNLGGDLQIKSSSSGTTAITLTGADVEVAGDLTVDTDTLYVDSANNRVGIGTSGPSAPLEIATTSTDDTILLTSTEDTSTASPVITLKRNSASPADGDYLGQLKFKGENDADQEVVYAKVTAKIQDASDASEDGLLEFANRKAGSNVITARLRSDSLQLLNGTGLTVAGDTTLSGTLNTHTIPSGTGTLALTSDLGLSNVVEDTTPQLGGNLDLNGKTINGTGNLDISNGTIKLAGSHPEGSNNTALGGDAGAGLTTGSGSNTLLGSRAGTSITTAVNNVAIGRNSLDANVTSGNNVAVGSSAGGSATGADNTFLGDAAGSSVTSGSNLTVIGRSAQASSATATNEITLGNTNITSLRIPGLQSSATDGDVLTFCSANGNIVLKAASGGGGSSTLGGLTDVTITSATSGQVLKYNGSAWVNDTAAGGISCFSYNSGSSALVATADLTSTCSALFGDVLISGNTITPDDSNTVTCLGADGTLNISGNLDVQGDFLKLPQADSSSCIVGNTASAGAIRYNTTTNTIQVHNGTEFTGVGGGGGGASSLNDLSDVTYETTTENLGIGTNALDSLQVGAPYNPTGNIAIGFNAGTNVSISGHNIALGYNALCNGCNVGHSVAIGCDALKELPQGQCNLAIGPGALRCQSEQLGQNMAIGAFAGSSITTGRYNTLLGIQAGWKLTSHCGNTIIGYKAALHLTPDCGDVGGRNTIIGWQANSNATVGGDRNVIIGESAGSLNAGCLNVYIGSNTGSSTTTASRNTYVGTMAGQNNTTGAGNNTAIGYFAGRCNQTGTVNTSIGYHAGYEGRGNCNVYLGPYAGGTSCHSGNNNVLIGYQSTPSSTTVSNEITLGHTTHTALRANVTTISSLSDCRDKTEIQPISVGLCFVKDLNPVQFKWDRRDETMIDVKEVGFIAQELDEVQQKHNIEDHLNIVLKSNPDRLEASPGKLIPILVKAIQELTKKVEELENKIGK